VLETIFPTKQLTMFKTSRVSFILFSLILLLAPQKSFSISGCALCASTGDCTQAFHYGAGKYCGSFHETFTSSKPCCCPNNSQCQVSSTACNCYVNDNNNNNSGYHRGYDYNNYNSGYVNDAESTGGFVTLVILVSLCICCCCMSNNNNHRA
jgi:hypothetical protein